jgi:hypothetical protein
MQYPKSSNHILSIIGSILFIDTTMLIYSQSCQINIIGAPMNINKYDTIMIFLFYLKSLHSKIIVIQICFIRSRYS